MTSYTILCHIEDNDPDGFPSQPTVEAAEAHREWAIRTYGQKAWDDYSEGGWGQYSDSY